MSWAKPRISTISVHDEPILRKKPFPTPRLKNILLDVRRFWRQAAEGEKIGKSHAFLTWYYKEAPARVRRFPAAVRFPPRHAPPAYGSFPPQTHPRASPNP